MTEVHVMTDIEHKGNSTDTTTIHQYAAADPSANQSRFNNMKSGLKKWFDPKPQLSDMLQVIFWKDMFLGFLAFAVIEVAVILVINVNNVNSNDHPIIGLFAALIIFSTIDGWGPMCGCLLNPCAVISFYLCGRMSFIRAFLKIAFELAAVSAGGMVGYGLVPDELKPLSALAKSPKLTLVQAAGIEGILTFNLMMVALSVTSPGRHTTLFSLTIGCAKGAGLICGAGFTGGIQNPFIAFGVAVAAGDFKNHFATYWAGPFIASVIAPIIYRVSQYFNLRAYLLDHYELNTDEILIVNGKKSIVEASTPLLTTPLENNWTSAIRGAASRF